MTKPKYATSLTLTAAEYEKLRKIRDKGISTIDVFRKGLEVVFSSLSSAENKEG